jgi:hypothetical protein
MSVLQFGDVFGSDDDPLLSGLTAFQRIDLGDDTYVATAGRNGLSVFRIGADRSFTLVDQMPFTTAFLPGRPPTLAAATFDGVPHLAVAGQMPGGTMLLAIAEDGMVSAADTPAGWPASIALVATSDTGPSVLTYDAFSGLLRLHGPDGAPLATTAGGQIGTLRALSTVPVDGTNFAVGIEGGTTIVVLRLSPDTPPVVTARLGADDGIGLAAGAHIATTVVAGETFVVAGGSGSSSLTILRLGADGGLIFADHVIDSLASRFQTLGALAVATAGGRTYVVAGGADDGVSIFVLLPGGRLFHLDAFADTLAATLRNVTALTAFPLDGDLVILAAG